MTLTLPFTAVGREHLDLVGGKGANLGECARAGLPVPPGFCLTTRAFDLVLAAIPGLPEALDRLEAAADAPAEASAALRALILARPLPEPVREALRAALEAEGGPELPRAVRSSATAEDLPEASFAGQQDTLLNVRGAEALERAARSCIASLFTERACVYRARQGISHRAVKLAVVVQRQVLPEVSGILFTADPVTGRRDVMSVDAGFGLGEALVSGLVDADLFRLRRDTGEIIECKIRAKKLGIHALPEGGTETRVHDEAEALRPSLGPAELEALRALGERVEAHYGQPQDIEWCLAQGVLSLLQARPVTTLFPLPAPLGPGLRVTMSLGHVQVMTAPMTPLGRDTWRHVFPFGRALGDEAPGRLLLEAGGRLYVDLTPVLFDPWLGGRVMAALSHIDERVAADLAEAMTRRDAPLTDGLDRRAAWPVMWRVAAGVLSTLLWGDPAARHQRVVAGLEAQVAGWTAGLEACGEPPARLAFVRRMFAGLLPGLAPVAAPLFGGVLAERLLARRVADTPEARAALTDLTRGLPDNVTTAMDLDVGDLADLARPHAALVAALAGGEDEPEALAALPGGEGFVAALRAFMGRWGVRGPGEIDLGQPRYAEAPGLVLRAVAGACAGGEPGAHRRHHAAMARRGEAAVARLAALHPGPRGWLIARLARVYRQLFALREHPKFALIRALELARRVALERGEALAAQGALDEARDVFMLRWAELASPPEDLRARVAARRAEMARFARLDPPRVLTSAGERVVAPLRRGELPANALAGVAASGGVVEGVARVILDPGREVLQAGEILVAPFTDPGWTPLFVNAAAVVLDVGGLMTHGSVVAREYGIPAVVSVDGATRALRTGERLRVDGDRGLVFRLDASDAVDSR